ncbi:hypothetical protein [Luteimicrobium subarcticum]|uniref:Uncharacterized protein n=1 Tax=Luteimicrobium subarcticum TaxID=620910 RepID=A0A2M8WR72_9MICO|nr:hypothetical protein [Luteimicrobium subarcticum]PJI93440.1 hypothetical protein CLV34_2013 [Luteimicrobium subarcticum]
MGQVRRTTWLWLVGAAVVVVVLAWGISGERPFVSWTIGRLWVVLLGAVMVRSVAPGAAGPPPRPVG